MRNEAIRVRLVESLGELIEFAEQVGRGGTPSHWFRGQADAAWSLQCRLWRRGLGAAGHGEAAYTHSDERNLAHRFRVRAATRRADAPNYSDAAGWLSLMQHYGLPTRLLDWSRSPLVAAYFALPEPLAENKNLQRDAAIWVLNPHELNTRRCQNSVTPGLSSRQLGRLVSDAFFDSEPRWAESHFRVGDHAEVMAAMAWEADPRMVVQQGAFTVHAAPRSGGLRGVRGLDEESDAHEYLTLLRIPNNTIARLRREVAAAGFREGDLFPDLEHLARELVDTYPAGSMT